MIDFHSHILPSFDDGSKNVEESCALLKMLSAQGVKKALLTPHFYADNESVDEFLKRRSESYAALKESLTEDMPEVLLGAEVKFYQGISRLENLKALCVNESNLLLLEMPFCKWTEYTVKEVLDIASNGELTVVLVHIERYFKFFNKGVLEKLLNNGVLMQANADFFVNAFTRKKALKMLFNQSIQLIGSDCHNLTTRPPRINEAFYRIEKKYGKGFVEYINDYGNNLFSNR